MLKMSLYILNFFVNNDSNVIIMKVRKKSKYHAIAKKLDF